MKKAVIFGVSGQDGAFLAQLLLKKGYRVIGVSRNTGCGARKNLDRLNIWDKIEFISASVSNFRNVLEVVNTHRPDEIYNLAGQSSVALSFEQPFETFESIGIATLNLLEVIRILKLPVKLFSAGSCDCFGNADAHPVTEVSPLYPRSPYGVAKAAAHWQVESYRKAHGLFACTGILSNHESHLRPEQFVTQKIVKTACGIAKGTCSELLLGDISIERDWGWAPEYVTAMWKMLQQDSPEDYIISTGTTVRLEAFIAAVFRHLDLDWKQYVKTDRRFMRPADIQTIRTNPGKAEKQLGWKAGVIGCDVARRMVDEELKNL